jgi:hypothetical protein
VDTVSLHVAPKLNRDSSIFNASNSVTRSPSAICGSAANGAGQFLDVLIGVEFLWRMFLHCIVLVKLLCILACLPYFERMKVGLRDHLNVCVRARVHVCVHI